MPERVLSRPDAERLIGGILAAMDELAGVLEAETGHLREGRLREGLSTQARKAELAGAYARGLEEVKANAVALARFAPEALARLRAAHARFAETVAANQTVLATARAVSEGLIRDVSTEVDRVARPQGYAPGGAPAPRLPRATPLVVAKNL
ncbi:MAG TPA: hypothetical protein VM434_06685 [Beijerinckiaceae bacterium]|nr:hypothetical protein [Beijerinckiaceae bacterium]